MTQTADIAELDPVEACERRCIVTGTIRPVDTMVRFVVGPDGAVVPDVAAVLPGRGLWVTADGEILARATAGMFSKAAKAPVTVGGDLVPRVEALIRKRMLGDLGLARKAGLLILGFDNICKALARRPAPAVLIEAVEAAADGRRKILSSASGHGVSLRVLEGLRSDELGLALGRENVIHAAIKPGSLAKRLILDGARLMGLRTSKVDGPAGGIPACNERNA